MSLTVDTMKIKGLYKAEPDPNFTKDSLGRIVDFFGKDCTYKFLNKTSPHIEVLKNGSYTLICSFALSDLIREGAFDKDVDHLKYHYIYYFEGKEWLVNSYGYYVDELKPDPNFNLFDYR